MRTPGLNKIFEMAKVDSKINFIGSDLGFGVLKEFQEILPNQFSMEGISEANIIGMAAGMSMRGKIVYINTIASFLTRRCLEQISIDLCLDKNKVRLFANGGGLIYGPMGPTHTIVEDISLMLSLPKMAIISPSDEVEMLALLEQSKNYDGPIYIRVARDNYPIISQNMNINFGEPLLLEDGNDFALLATGYMTHKALMVQKNLKTKALNPKVIDFHTIRPIDEEKLLNQLRGIKKIIVLEEHIKHGGLYSIIANLVLENKLEISIKSISLPHEYLEIYGEQQEIMDRIGLSDEEILKTCFEFFI